MADDVDSVAESEGVPYGSSVGEGESVRVGSSVGPGEEEVLVTPGSDVSVGNHERKAPLAEVIDQSIKQSSFECHLYTRSGEHFIRERECKAAHTHPPPPT